jgi:hypothetical protein
VPSRRDPPTSSLRNWLPPCCYRVLEFGRPLSFHAKSIAGNAERRAFPQVKIHSPLQIVIFLIVSEAKYIFWLYTGCSPAAFMPQFAVSKRLRNYLDLTARVTFPMFRPTHTADSALIRRRPGG